MREIVAGILALLLCYAKGNSLLRDISMDRHKEEKAIDEDINNDLKIEDFGNDIALPDHIPAIKMERDGDENANYHKEVFLGAEAEKFKNGEYKVHEQKKKLKDLFGVVDINSDGEIDEKEMTDWVLTKTREHFYEARMNNENVFRLMDVDTNEEVSWNEFLSQFLSEKGFTKKDIFEQLSAGETLKLAGNLEDKIQELKEKWIQVQDIGKTSLTITQFFNFQHPETSKEMLRYLVEDILHDMDTDDSNDLTIQEYVAMAPDANVDASKDIWVKERCKEYRTVIDQDLNGIVDTKELEAYLDPLSRTMAGQEARQLIGFGDLNDDGKLTLQEILENSEYYTGSKLYNYALSIHEEF